MVDDSTPLDKSLNIALLLIIFLKALKANLPIWIPRIQIQIKIIKIHNAEEPEPADVFGSLEPDLIEKKTCILKPIWKNIKSQSRLKKIWAGAVKDYLGRIVFPV